MDLTAYEEKMETSRGIVVAVVGVCVCVNTYLFIFKRKGGEKEKT